MPIKFKKPELIDLAKKYNAHLYSLADDVYFMLGSKIFGNQFNSFFANHDIGYDYLIEFKNKNDDYIVIFKKTELILNKDSLYELGHFDFCYNETKRDLIKWIENMIISIKIIEKQEYIKKRLNELEQDF